jgi:hypothetical protein
VVAGDLPALLNLIEEAAINHRGLSVSTSHLISAAPQKFALSVSLRHGQEGNRISEAHRQLPYLDQRVCASAISVDRPFCVENFLELKSLAVDLSSQT